MRNSVEILKSKIIIGKWMWKRKNLTKLFEFLFAQGTLFIPPDNDLLFLIL